MCPLWFQADRGCRSRLASRWWVILLVGSVSLIVGQRGMSDETGGGGAIRKQATPRESTIDQLLAESWRKAGVKPAPLATDEEFVRRVYLDLVGRIPSVSEATAFFQTRESGKRAKLVEYLLEHPDYPQWFATQWTILLLGRGDPGERVDRSALVAWLRKQFAANRPWNELVHDLIAASGSNRENGAVNFVLAHLEPDAVPLTSRTTRLFLGRQLQCAQCHDHPSNEWKQSDFWSLNAFFKGIRVEGSRSRGSSRGNLDAVVLADEPTEDYARFEKRNGMVGVAFPRFLDGRKLPAAGEVERRAELARMISEPTNDALAQAFVNRMWAHFLGRGLVSPVDDLGPHNPPSHPELLEFLAREFQSSGYDVKQLIRLITASRAYQATSERPKNSSPDESPFQFHSMQLRPMSPEQLFDSLLTATGAHRAGGSRSDEKRDRWLRQFLYVFGNDEGEELTTFQGTIPQALMMMNGELIREAVSAKPGSFLAETVRQAEAQPRPAVYLVNQLYLAALSRSPTARELAQAGLFLQTDPNSLDVLQDLFWALLNSNEFILIH
jgi:hypothetical protein